MLSMIASVLFSCAISLFGTCWYEGNTSTTAPVNTAAAVTTTVTTTTTETVAPAAAADVVLTDVVTPTWQWSDTIKVLTPNVQIVTTACKDEDPALCQRWNVYVEGVKNLQGGVAVMPNNAILMVAACKTNGSFINEDTNREEYGIPADEELWVRGFTARPCPGAPVASDSVVVDQATNSTGTLTEIPTPTPVPEPVAQVAALDVGVDLNSLVVTSVQLHSCEDGASLCWNAYQDNDGKPVAMEIKGCQQDGGRIEGDKEVPGLPVGKHNKVVGITLRQCPGQ